MSVRFPTTEEDWIQVHKEAITDLIDKAVADLEAGRLTAFYLWDYCRQVEVEAMAWGYREGRRRYREVPSA